MITRGVLLHTHMNPVTVGFEIKFLDVDRYYHGTTMVRFYFTYCTVTLNTNTLKKILLTILKCNENVENVMYFTILLTCTTPTRYTHMYRCRHVV